MMSETNSELRLDVTQAWDAVRMDARQCILAGRKPVTLAQEIRYALMLTAANHPDAEIPYVLLVTAVQQGLLRPEQAYVVARQISDPKRRVEVLALLSDYLTEPQKREALTQALAVVQEFDNEDARRGLVATLVPHLTAELFPQALSLTREFQHPWKSVRTLVTLASIADEQEKNALLREALAAARSNAAEDDRAGLLTVVARSLPASQKSNVLEESLALAVRDPDPVGRALNFKEIALEFMQAGQADRAYSTAIAIPDGGIRVRALEEIEPLLPLELQQKALEQTLVAIPEMVEDEKGQSFALQRLIEKLPAAMLVPCRAIVEAMPNRYRRFWPLEQVSKPVV